MLILFYAHTQFEQSRRGGPAPSSRSPVDRGNSSGQRVGGERHTPPLTGSRMPHHAQNPHDYLEASTQTAHERAALKALDDFFGL